MIELVGATLEYEDHGKIIRACDSATLRVDPGEFLGILGPSGSGKSSLLYLMSGLKQPTRGDVIFEGQNLAEMSDLEKARIRRETFGFVFQHPHLVSYLTAVENLLVATEAAGAEQEAQTLLRSLGVSEKQHRYPHQLSGGERQRVCVARALIGGRRAIFADEPTAALDHTTGKQVVDLLVKNRGAGALIMVTHDPTMLEAADRIIQIQDGQIHQESAAGVPSR